MPTKAAIAGAVALALVVALYVNLRQNRVEAAMRAAATHTVGPDEFQADMIQLVEQGKFPPKALRAILPNGTLEFDINGDGATTDDVVVIRLDAHSDGRPEGLTEQELMYEFDREAPRLEVGG